MEMAIPIIDLMTPPPEDPAALAFLSGDPRLQRQLARRGQNAPEPRPSRNWAAMDDLLPQWDREAFDDSLRNNADVLHRDAYSRRKHLAGFDAVYNLHHWARENNPGVPPATGLYLYSGPMGEGKSLGMGAAALSGWAFQAIPVLSNMSVRFGYKISGSGIFSAMERAEPGSIILIDEIAALMDNFSGNANRSRTFSASMTAFRKKSLLMLVGTANEAGILSDVRRHAQAIISPKKYWPRVRGRDGRMRPAQEGELSYHPFCYMTHLALGEPWVNNRTLEDALRATLNPELPTKESGANKRSPLADKWRNYRDPLPGICNLAALVSDTLDRVPIGDALDILRDDMTADRQAIQRGETPGGASAAVTLVDAQSSGDPLDFLRWFMSPASKAFNPPGPRLRWQWLNDQAAEYGISIKRGKIREAIEAAGVPSTKMGVLVQDLRDFYQTLMLR